MHAGVNAGDRLPEHVGAFEVREGEAEVAGIPGFRGESDLFFDVAVQIAQSFFFFLYVAQSFINRSSTVSSTSERRLM